MHPNLKGGMYSSPEIHGFSPGGFQYGVFRISVPAEDADVLTRSPLRVSWTKDGWLDTPEEEKVWDEDEYYAHLDNLDFG